MTVRVRDKGAKRLLSQMRRLKKDLQVGVIGSKAAKPHGAKAAKRPKGEEPESETAPAPTITTADIALWHELGLGVPQRSWLRAWFDGNTRKLIRKAQESFKKKGVNAKGLNLLGLWIVGEIQQRIADGIRPSNAESTIARKGSSKPLIDTGQFRTSITHRLVDRE